LVHTPPSGFHRVDGAQVHFSRRRAILHAHPEVKGLAGPNRWTALATFGMVAAQLSLAVLCARLPWWAILLVAYGAGAVLSHALYVMIHEATHNLVARSVRANRLLGLASDLALGFPGAMAFRKYHLLHHRFLGEPRRDADLAAPWEARLVGRSWWRKTVWMSLFAVSQALRPMSLRDADLLDRWIVLDALAVFGVDALLWVLVGPWAVLYLVVSLAFGLGLHPLGGRWIQEHYVTRPGQETYSYYGAANVLAYNVGYHNEHHDFMNVPWNRLPKIRAAAPEFYEGLRSYRSWTAVLLRFLFDPRLSPSSRIVHPDTALSRPLPTPGFQAAGPR
jgi:sphingolipid 4-desaturase/C4-monooxygenase